MALTAALEAWDMLPSRFGFLDVPQDLTVRRLDREGGPSPVATKDADDKRIFKSIYAIRVSSELLRSDVEVYTAVVSTHLTLNQLT
jgi:hypothetical protein